VGGLFDGWFVSFEFIGGVRLEDGRIYGLVNCWRDHRCKKTLSPE